ncbi:MAG: glycoside hydrolase family 5 protein [Chloroflexi bacterium]|nr:MAG: glycoside hydrolase family 5 protein [Chloroflexota bacterium]
MQRLLTLLSIACLVAVGLAVTRPGRAATDVVITVRASSAEGTLATRLGTQFAWPGSLDRAAGSRGRFNALAPGLVRINATTDGVPGLPLVMPAGITKGDWNFANLDAIVNDVRAAGGLVVLDIAYAPQWMWDCSTGAIRDTTFAEFASYMARVVSYYSLGSFVAEDGTTITNPAGTANRIGYWEVWNEPDQRALGCPPGGNPNINTDQYVAMWNASVPAMLAVDPAIKLVGPATSSAMPISAPDFLGALLANAKHKPDVVSFHAYGGWHNAQTDRFFFDGDTGCCGIAGIERGLIAVQAAAPGIPIWITELNVNSDSAADDPTQRPWTAFGAAWGASAFGRLARHGVQAIFEFQFANPSLRQLSLIEIDTGRPLLPYWRDYYLARSFPAGSTLLSTSSSNPEVETFAARSPESNVVRVLVVNRQVDSDSATGGGGLPATVRVTLQDLPRVGSVTVRRMDAATPLDTGPELQSLPASDSVTVDFSGYGLALIEFVPEAVPAARR